MRNVGYDSHIKNLLKTCVELEECEDFYECVEFLNQGFRNGSLRYRIAGAGEDNAYHAYLKSMSREDFYNYIVIPVLKELYPRSTEVEHALEQTSMVCMNKVPRAGEHSARSGLNIMRRGGNLWLSVCLVNLLAASVAVDNQGAESDSILYWWLGSLFVTMVSSCVALSNMDDLNLLQRRIENEEELEQVKINSLHPCKLVPRSEIFLEDGGALIEGYEIGDGLGGGGGGGGAIISGEEIDAHQRQLEEGELNGGDSCTTESEIEGLETSAPDSDAEGEGKRPASSTDDYRTKLLAESPESSLARHLE